MKDELAESPLETGDRAPDGNSPEQSRELKMLTSVAQGFSLSSDPESLAREILERTRVFIPTAVGRLWSLSNDGLSRSLVASIGLRHAPSERALKPGQGMGGASVTTRETIVSLNVLEDPQFLKKDWARSEGLVSSIMLPLVHRGRVCGNLSVFTRNQYHFSDSEKRLLEAFAAHAALAIENNRLYGELHQELAERKSAQDALRQHQAQLEEIVEKRTAKLAETQAQLLRKERLAAVGQLTASVSHELRNPLSTIRMSLESLESALGRGEVAPRKTLDRIVRNIGRCDAIISDLLDYTEPSTAKKTLTRLAPWLEDVLDDLILPEALTLHRQVEQHVEVALDENRFRRVIINLIQNAAQAMTDPEILDYCAEPTIHVRCRGESDRVLIVVEDNGPGIAADVLPKVFEPLFSTKGFGMGLGLAIVQQIMQQHQGGIEVHSRVGEGTRVQLWLPCQS